MAGCIGVLGAVAMVSLGLALLNSRPGGQLQGKEADIVAD